ncbi:MAG: Flagellar hook-basal body complex protein FliE [Pseudomonadota bacterium]|jgi:flagellar hook-basal body complex protein FliE
MAIVNDTSGVLAQIRDYQSRISEQRSRIDAPARDTTNVTAPAQENFSGLITQALRNGLDQVNGLQQRSNVLMNRYEAGEDVPLTDVVLAMQTASIGFEATLQIRNKVMKAYEDIMNMPV